MDDTARQPGWLEATAELGTAVGSIAQFVIQAPLGAGGMGIVYRARDTKLGRAVALKVLPSQVVSDPEQLRRFQQEAQAASALNHPNVVTIYEVGEFSPPGSDRVVHYIAMELIEGRTLRELILDRDTSLLAALGWLAQVADGLARAHDVGIVHRDLKPDNVMIGRDGYAKILDFGIAKLMHRAVATTTDPAGKARAGAGTQAGTLLGTLGYMSPEQVRGETVGPSTDLFAFGCILYEAMGLASVDLARRKDGDLRAAGARSTGDMARPARGGSRKSGGRGCGAPSLLPARPKQKALGSCARDRIGLVPSQMCRRRDS